MSHESPPSPQPVVYDEADSPSTMTMPAAFAGLASRAPATPTASRALRRMRIGVPPPGLPVATSPGGSHPLVVREGWNPTPRILVLHAIGFEGDLHDARRRPRGCLARTRCERPQAPRRRGLP